jgi:AraC-like DNA-binding protein
METFENGGHAYHATMPTDALTTLREWRMLVKTEGALFAGLQRHHAGLPLDLAALAHEQGFADQAHLSRATKRITGFAPAEFARRFVEDESFWVYRLWV